MFDGIVREDHVALTFILWGFFKLVINMMLQTLVFYLQSSLSSFLHVSYFYLHHICFVFRVESVDWESDVCYMKLILPTVSESLLCFICSDASFVDINKDDLKYGG